MTRWEPDARGRLQQAALELCSKQGYEQTTLAEIAARAGLTERTFFRYFADKREVLFWGSGALQKALLDALASTPSSTAPLDAVAAAMEAVSPVFDRRRDSVRQRQVVIAAHAELQERELIKLASLASVIAEALRQRGVKDPAATLIAEAGVAVFKISFERWIHDARRRDLSRHVRGSLDELKAVVAGDAIGQPRPSSSGTTRASRPKRPTGRRPSK